MRTISPIMAWTRPAACAVFSPARKGDGSSSITTGMTKLLVEASKVILTSRTRPIRKPWTSTGELSFKAANRIVIAHDEWHAVGNASSFLALGRRFTQPQSFLAQLPYVRWGLHQLHPWWTGPQRWEAPCKQSAFRSARSGEVPEPSIEVQCRERSGQRGYPSRGAVFPIKPAAADGLSSPVVLFELFQGPKLLLGQVDLEVIAILGKLVEPDHDVLFAQTEKATDVSRDRHGLG